MSKAPKHWLGLITSDRELENIDELTRDIYTHFDGIVAVVHRQGGNSDVASLLHARVGQGFVKEIAWTGHHSHSMNHWLLDPRIGPMDTCWVRDSLERFNPAFTSQIPAFSRRLLDAGIWNIAQWSKVLMFRRWYGQQFAFGLHWGLLGTHGNTVAIERLSGFERERDYAYSVRNEKRPPTHRIRHEVYYLLDYGLNGNHLALFHPNPSDLDQAYQRLHHFTDYLAERGVRGVDQYTEWLKTEWARDGRLPDQVRDWINAERPFRNHLRFEVLHHTHEDILKDEDTWRLV